MVLSVDKNFTKQDENIQKLGFTKEDENIQKLSFTKKDENIQELLNVVKVEPEKNFNRKSASGNGIAGSNIESNKWSMLS